MMFSAVKASTRSRDVRTAGSSYQRTAEFSVLLAGDSGLVTRINLRAPPPQPQPLG